MSTSLDQAIFNSGYALTERETHIAEHFWKARDKEIADLSRQQDEWREVAKQQAALLKKYQTRYHGAEHAKKDWEAGDILAKKHAALVKKEGGSKPVLVVCCSCKTVLQPSKVFLYAGIPHCHECWKVENDIDANCS